MKVEIHAKKYQTKTQIVKEQKKRALEYVTMLLITTNKSPADADSRKKWRSTPVQIEVLRTRVVRGNNSFLGVNKSLAWLFWWGESDGLCFATFERLHLDTAQQQHSTIAVK